jgi:pimeloyl-ACP methyl ester carboxylesterase
MREFVSAHSGEAGRWGDVVATRVERQARAVVRANRFREVERRLFAAAGIEPRERRITLPRLGIEARVLEVGTGEPTLFLHGGPNAGATWSYLAASTSGLRCLLVDRPGTGLSAPLLTVPDSTTLGRVQEDLTVDVLDALGIERAHLVGSSLGGFAALRSAASYPNRVLRMVLLGCPAFVPGWTQPRFFKLLRTPVLGRAVLALPPTRASVRMSLRELGHDRSLGGGTVPAPMLEWIHAWQADTDTMRNDAAMIVRCGTWRHGFDASLDLDDDVLGTVHAPTLVVAGTDDPVGGEKVARGLVNRLPRAEVEVMDGAGHLPWLDDPDYAAKLTTSFLTTGGRER